MADIVIAGAARTPVGAFNGALASLAAPRAGPDSDPRGPSTAPASHPGEVNEVVLGQVLAGGRRPGPGAAGLHRRRHPGRDAGLEPQPALRIGPARGGAEQHSKSCRGDSAIVVAGGQESMSQAPQCSEPAQRREDGQPELVDTMIKDGLWDAFHGYHMGNTAENVAERWQITREQQDTLAVASQSKAEAAQTAGRFKDEIVPVTIKGRKGDTVVDQGLRASPATA